MNKELVEKLKNKDYVREFGRMSKEERELYKKVGARNCVRYSAVLGTCGWYDAFDFYEQFSYAIKSDYQPEPEFKDIEIKEYQFKCVYGPNDVHMLGIEIFKNDRLLIWPLHEIPSLPNFKEFWRKGTGQNTESLTGYLDVANQIRAGNKVYARFIKE